jgi:hypothetical protein
MLLDLGDRTRAVAAATLEDARQKECSSMKLTSEDEIAAAEYALQVFNAALSEARRH